MLVVISVSGTPYDHIIIGRPVFYFEMFDSLDLEITINENATATNRMVSQNVKTNNGTTFQIVLRNLETYQEPLRLG